MHALDRSNAAKAWEAIVGTLAKIVCLGFGALYVLGLLLFLIAPMIRKLLRPRLSNQDRHKANNND
jgi:hypothetical protein